VFPVRQNTKDIEKMPKKKKTNEPDDIPKNISEAIIRFFWTSRKRGPLFFITILFFSIFMIWNTLPEKSKLNIISAIGGDTKANNATKSSKKMVANEDKKNTQSWGGKKADSKKLSVSGISALISDEFHNNQKVFNLKIERNRNTGVMFAETIESFPQHDFDILLGTI
jgi:hypothetical protein